MSGSALGCGSSGPSVGLAVNLASQRREPLCQQSETCTRRSAQGRYQRLYSVPGRRRPGSSARSGPRLGPRHEIRTRSEPWSTRAGSGCECRVTSGFGSSSGTVGEPRGQPSTICSVGSGGRLQGVRACPPIGASRQCGPQRSLAMRPDGSSTGSLRPCDTLPRWGSRVRTTPSVPRRSLWLAVNRHDAGRPRGREQPRQP